ncbi:hypothetical protein ACWDR1_30795 [Streptosporangium sandarakinum]|uniref:hypothetical protein n=1 Tax=Streptosporangium sandarakinum TaxID=1260955 RepID=UPI0033A4DD61
MARRTPRDELSATESLTVALQALTIFHGYVQQADTKAATVSTVHLGFTAIAATQADAVREVWVSGTPAAVTVVVVAVVFATGCLVSGHHFLSALRPRLLGPDIPTRFGLVRRAGSPSPADAVQQQREVWTLISTLADIALAKHERIRRGLPWLALMPVATITWLALTALTG